MALRQALSFVVFTTFVSLGVHASASCKFGLVGLYQFEDAGNIGADTCGMFCCFVFRTEAGFGA